MSSRLFAMLLWALAAASVVFWAMRLVTTAAPIPDGTRLAANGPIVGGDLSRLFGAPRVETSPAAAAPPPAASRFLLTGIVSTSSKRGHDDTQRAGVALISVDGGPARAYRVGEALDSQLSLWSVALRSARIGARSGSGAQAFVLELPAPAAPATGTLAAAAATVAQPAPMMSAPFYGASAPVVVSPPAMIQTPSLPGAPPALMQPPPQASDLRSGKGVGNVPGNALNNLGGALPGLDNRQGVPNSPISRQ